MLPVAQLEEGAKAMLGVIWQPRLKGILTLILLVTACHNAIGRRGGGQSNLATVTIGELSETDYDRILLQAFRPDDTTQAVMRVEAKRGEGKLQGTVAPGQYVLKLEYFAGDSVRYSSLACGNPPEFVLQAGDNAITIYLCDGDGRRVSRDTISCDPTQPVRGPRQMRLLTNIEYQSTVRDLVGLTDDVAGDFPKEIKHHGIDSLADTRKVTEAHAEAYYRAAGKVAAKVRADRTRFAACTAGEPEIDCITRFIRSFGKRAFRGPLTTGEVEGLRQVFGSAKQDGGSFDEALELTVQAMLIAPRFLYRYELGQETADAFELDPYEIAQALSYLYWGTMPDTRLFELADSGDLRKPEVMRAEAARLFNDPRAREVTGRFVVSWLGSDAILAVNKDNELHPEFDSALRSSLLRETREFFNDVVFARSGRFSDLFLSQQTFGDSRVASLYGSESVAGRIEVNTSERRGLLGHASVLATYADADQTAPIKRGVFVLERLLCQEMPPPPAALMVKPPPRDPNASTRERFAAHSQNPACASCHKRIDGAGFGFEDMDEVGRYRTQQVGKPVDASGMLYTYDGKQQAFNGTAELSELIAKSSEAEMCFVKQLYRRTSGRLETQADACVIESLHQRLTDPNTTLKDVMLAIPEQEAFRLKQK